MSKDEILTRPEVAREYKMPLRTVDYYVATNQIPYSRLGRRLVRFSRKRLDEWFREREGISFNRNPSGDK